MQITATRIVQWARTKEGQAALPRLVRRLIHAGETPLQADFPAGDSTGLPGWDGELLSEHGSPWVPKGKSFWELSCEAGVTSKANKDYAKRTRQTSKKIRTKATFVVLSARRWSQKAAWLKTKRRGKQWAEVRAYDADDLEQWLEQNPAVALQFSEELGLVGQGVESVAKYWENWSQQSNPPIISDAFLIDRRDIRDRFLADILRWLEGGRPEPYSIKADSIDEAAAFVCAALNMHPQLSATCLVVTDPSGWRYVEKNPTIKVALAARREFAEKPTRRNGLVVIIPYATGDMAGYYRGVAGRDSNAELTIDRPRIYEFEKALMSIGLGEAESKRLAVSTGRSWSVYRRRCAANPAVRKPAWLDVPQASVLSTLCLLGGWSAEKPGDREIVAQLSGRPYEEVERALRNLAQADDAPVLQIGEVWKARSPLELLDLFGERITSDEVDRFFKIAQSILVTPDPQLDLPDEERHAAQIYGKVRPQSGLLIEALCDTLIKLAVRGPQVPALASANIKERVAALVRDLLYDADGTRWLSLSSFLPDLAEAAPEAFMGAVEASLTKPNAPVTRLLTETSNSGIIGRCWHSGLLWALERLAWAPERLARVSLILMRFSHIKIKGNWGNSPKASLVDIFRSWFPRTAANIDQRIAVLDTLIAKEPDVSFDLLDKLAHVGFDSATQTARPSWRDDDAGAGYGATHREQHQMLVAAADRLIACSKDHPQRIACLVGKISTFDADRINTTLALADQFTKPGVSDEDREVIRGALRKHIHWHRNYDKVQGASLNQKLQPIEDLYERLAPKDLVIRHRWLFTDGWPNLPARVLDGGYGKRGELVETWRTKALCELYSERGLSGIEQLATACAPQSYYVGLALSKLNIEVAELAKWIAGKGGDFTVSESSTMAISGLLRALACPCSMELIRAVLETSKKHDWEPGRVVRFLVLAPEQRTTWDIVGSCGTEIENAYWSTTNPSWLPSDPADFEFALRRLLAEDRPRSALQVCLFDVEKVDAKLLAEMLERMLKGEESGGPLPDSWHLGEAVERLEASGAIDNDRLVRLEFGLLPALGYEGEQHARSLYNAIMSDPKLFTELLCIRYKPANAEREDAPSEAKQAAARIAWRVLHHCRRQPGTKPDGTIDPGKFTKFIGEARELCREADMLGVCDSQLGQILAHAPAGADGVWPFEAAREVLDRPEHEDIRRGFLTGTMNKRGVTSRSPDEGGGQERGLAEEFRKYARALQNSHVHLAAALEEVARSYERYGLREDLEAKLRREGH
jgi:hypothetical protein